MPAFVLAVRFCDGRYHGFGADGNTEWPPSPARVFQALIAGAAKGSILNRECKEALAWVEALNPPIIKAPTVINGQFFKHFMPNNDFDSTGGDPRRITEIRTAIKRFHPRIFDSRHPLSYVWSFNESSLHAERLCEMALSLYQLGRGVDIAWAVGKILDNEGVITHLAAVPGVTYSPAVGVGSVALPCPRQGSLSSLLERYEKTKVRFRPVFQQAVKKKRAARTELVGWAFSQSPKPHFRMVSYNCPSTRLLYEIRQLTRTAGFSTFPVDQTARLVEAVRNAAAAKLGEAWSEKARLVNRVYGLWREAGEGDKRLRLQIIPIPSIGHAHVDRGVRRLLVMIPPDCPLPTEDIAWSFSSVGDLSFLPGETPWTLVPAQDQGMLDHYGVGDENQGGYRIWRTVTPMVLSVHRPSGKKNGTERASIEQKAAGAVVQALRHAGVKGKPTSIRVQREPFDAKGIMAGEFASGTRFAPSQLWHVEIAFAERQMGPLVVGDGRYLGLGMMSPVKKREGVFAFSVIDGLSTPTHPGEVAKALRKAVMALVQACLGPRSTLPTFFTGHEPDGSPARRGGRTHLAFAYDSPRQRLIIIAPHLMERREATATERRSLSLLGQALSGLDELRAGPVGLLKLEPFIVFEDTDPLFCLSRTWVAQTHYRPTRYVKHTTPEEAIIYDLKAELSRRNLPIPTSVDELEVVPGPRGGLAARMRLVFATTVRGPLLLGRDSNLGGGLFVSAKPPSELSSDGAG